MQGAIARRADEAFDQLHSTQQEAARRLFLSLVRAGEGQQDTRVPAPFPEAPGEVAAYPVPLNGAAPRHLEALTDNRWSFSGDPVAVAIANDRPVGETQRGDGKAIIWDLRTGEKVQSLQGVRFVQDVWLPSDGAWMASFLYQGEVHIRPALDESLHQNLDPTVKRPRTPAITRTTRSQSPKRGLKVATLATERNRAD